MSRHLRNLVYFILGFAAICLAGFSSAGVPFYVDDGQVYSNGQLQRSVHGSPGSVFTASNCANDPYLNVSRQGGFTISGANGVAANGPLVETGKVTRAAAVAGAVKYLKVGGVYGVAAGVIGGYVVEKGWEWASDKWMKPGPAETVSGTWKYPVANGFTGSASAVAAYTASVKGWGSSYTYYLNGAFLRVKQTNGYGDVDCTRVSYDTPPAQKIAATDSDLLTEADNAVCSNPSAALKQLADEKIDVDSEGQPFTYSSPEPIATPKTVTETATKTNPDGSTTTTETQRWQEYKPDPSPVPYGNPVPVQVENKSTTTTTNYNIDNSTTTTTETKTENVSKGGVPSDPTKPQEQQKSQCELTPNAVGCLELGDAPTAPDLGTDSVTLSFSWTPFSMPAQCPAPVQVNTHLIPAFTIPYDGLCNAADIARPLIIAGAFLTALGIIFGGRSDD